MQSNELIRELIKHRTALLGFLWSLVRDHHLADDLFQDIAALALEKADEINDAAHLAAWSRKVARLKAMEAMRSRSRRAIVVDERILDLLEETASGMDEARNTSPEADLERLATCMNKLPERSRELLRYKYTEGYSGSQVAEAVKMTLGSVYVTLSRIHKALEECLRRGVAGEAHG